MKGMKEYRELTERLYKVPQSVQQLIPVHRIAEDGIFLLENKPEGAEVLFDKAYLFLDTNFATMDDAEKDDFLRQYCMLLNSLSVSFKVMRGQAGLKQVRLFVITCKKKDIQQARD